MKTTLEHKHIAALATLMGVKDSRPHINGVWVEARSPDVIAFATNGYSVGAMLTGASIEEGGEFDVFIPGDVAIAIAKSNKNGRIEIESPDGKQWSATNTLNGTRWVWADAQYAPFDWRRVTPRTTSGAVGQFQPVLINNFAKAAAILTGEKQLFPVLIAHNGADTAQVQIPRCPEFIGAVMPAAEKAVSPYMRHTPPDWAMGGYRQPEALI